MKKSIISAGMNQGLIAYVYTASEIKFETSVPEHTGHQEFRVVIREYRPDQSDIIVDFISRCRSVGNCYVVLETQVEKVTPPWRMANWVTLHTSVSKYHGSPANEIFVYWDSNEQLTTMHNPIVWVHKEKEPDVAKFLAWAAQQVIPIRILRV